VRDDQLHAFLGDARAHTAADARRRRRWLARQLDEDRTFEEVCSGAVQARAPVDVLVTSGRTHRGRIMAAQAGVVTVACADGGTTYITGVAIVGVRLRPDVTAADHQRVTPAEGMPTDARVVGATLGDVLRELAERRMTVLVGTVDNRVHRGRIEGVGRDVLHLAGGMHLRLDLVTEVSTVT
jgi:hypothetical protein